MRKLIYIYGLGYSGSTVLDIFLGLHPNIIGLGELYGLLEVRHVDPKEAECGCSNTMNECVFWKNVAPKYETIRNAQTVTERYKLLINAFDEYLPSDIALVDSSKCLNALNSILRLKEKVVIKPIYLIRDARGQAFSTKRHRSKRGRWVNSLAALLNWWIKNLHFQRTIKKMGIPYITIHYEDFCENPERTMQKISEFAGLFIPDLHLCELSKSQSHTIFGNPMRTDNKRKRKLTCDKSWHKDHAIRLWYKLLWPVAYSNRLWRREHLKLRK